MPRCTLSCTLMAFPPTCIFGISYLISGPQLSSVVALSIQLSSLYLCYYLKGNVFGVMVLLLTQLLFMPSNSELV